MQKAGKQHSHSGKLFALNEASFILSPERLVPGAMKEYWVTCKIPTIHNLSGRANSLSFYYLIFKCYNYIDLFVLRGHVGGQMATLGSVLSFNMRGRALNSSTQAGLEHPYPLSHLTGPIFMYLRWGFMWPRLVLSLLYSWRMT